MFPGIGGGLVLGAPFFAVASGTLTEISPCLSCPSAFADLTFQVPRGVPRGATVALQALSFGGGRPSFTVGIVGTG